MRRAPAPPAASPSPGTRTPEAERRQHRTVALYYLGDALALSGLALQGVLPLQLPLLLALGGWLLTGGLWLATHTAWFHTPRYRQVADQRPAIAVVLVLGVAWQAPQVGGLLLLSLSPILASGAMRLSRPAMRLLVLGTAAAALGLILASPQALGIPLATPAQRWLSAGFVVVTLGKTAGLHLAALALNQQLAASHARLADALATVELLASHDELTGLPNRRAILQRVDDERLRMQRSGIAFAIGLLDIDHFKQVNDTHGHPVGDAVLQALAHIAGQALRRGDCVGRLGGEEFLLVLPGPMEPGDTAGAGERLRARIEAHDWARLAPGLHVTASIGLVCCQPGEATAALLERGDRLLYAAKRGGRNRVETG